MNFDNPAYRLLSILKAGRKIPVETKCRKAWAELLDIDENSPELYARLGKIMEIPSQIISELRLAYPEEPDGFDHCYNQLQNAFSGNELNSKWSSFISHIDVHTITYLELNASRLNNKSKTKAADLEFLKNTRKTLNELIESIIASEIEQDVKIPLCRNLRKLIEAIDEYNISGSVTMFDAIEILIGHGYFDPRYKEVLKNTDIGKNIVTLLGTFADMLAITQGIPQISEGVKYLIEKFDS